MIRSELNVRRLELRSSPASEQLDQQQDHRYDEDQVNQAARNMKAKAKKPEDNEDDYKGIEHKTWFISSSQLLGATRVKVC